MRPAWSDPKPANAVLLIHGVGATGEAWDAWVPYLAAHLPTITMDLPGHGDSLGAAVVKGDVSIWSRDVVDVLESAGYASGHLIGESFGGTMGMQLAAERPELVQSLTICSATHRGDWVEGLTGWRAMLEAPGGFEEWCQMMLRNRFGSARLVPGFRDWYATRQAKTTVEAVLGVAESLLATDLTPVLPKIAQPTLIIAPEASPFLTNKVPQQLHSLVARSVLVHVAGARHGVSFSHPYDCVRAVASVGPLRFEPLASAPAQTPAIAGGIHGDR